MRVEGVVEGELLEAVVKKENEQKFHFIMCNPPFYRYSIFFKLVPDITCCNFVDLVKRHRKRW